MPATINIDGVFEQIQSLECIVLSETLAQQVSSKDLQAIVAEVKELN